jgi:SAM-dependent MidA family methyltransferase
MLTSRDPGSPVEPVRWSAAIDRALYGPGGFYATGEGAAGHFRTSASASASIREIFAEAVGELLDRVDSALGHPDPLDLVDVGGGSGDLLEAVLDSVGSSLAARVRPTAVELRPRPAALSAHVAWLDAVPESTGLLIANEWLDNVGIDVVVDDRVLLVDVLGVESRGPAPTAEEAAWLTRWWPSGQRREIGLNRDAAWAGVVSRIHRGLAVAIDYTHVALDRPMNGTLIGFRRGRETDPIPDGSSDVTAHVAIDSVAAAGEESVAAAGGESVTTAGGESVTAAGQSPRVRAVATMLIDQRAALRALGVSGRRPDYAEDPIRYSAALQRASEAAELLDPTGLGAFQWLLQGIDLDPTAILS